MPEFLRTHPITQSRIADSRSRADQYPKAGRKDSDYFQLIKARLRVLLADDKNNNLRQFRSEASEENASTATQYGSALALTHNGLFGKARELLNVLLTQSADNVHYVIALAELEVADKKDNKALTLLAENFKLNPHNHAITLLYAKTLILTKQVSAARDLLQTHLRRGNTNSAATYKLLSQALGKTNATVEAHEALAEYYLLSGNSAGAIEQLEFAAKFAGAQDAQAAQRIEARLEQLQPKKDKSNNG